MEYFNDYSKELKMVEEYVTVTPSHYRGDEPLSLFKKLGLIQDFCKCNIIKYAIRDKGQEQSDLLKIIHYALISLKEQNNK